MKAKRCPLGYRLLSALLAVMVPAPSLPTCVWAAPLPDSPRQADSTTSGELLPTRVVSGPPALPVRRLPVTQVAFNSVPAFSSEPAVREFANVRMLEQALVPVGATTAPENKLLAAAITQYVQRPDLADQSALLGFLEQFPQSAWRPALLVNMGVAWRQTGFFTKAMNAWEEAWTLSRNEKADPAKSIADRACAELLQMNAWAGRLQVIEPLLGEVAGRQFSPGTAEMISGAREASWFMKNHPEKSFACGPYALREILRQAGRNADAAKVIEAKSTGHGFNLTEVAALADEFGLKYQMARRAPGSAVPLNSIVHWKLDHYGAITKEANGKYLVQDRAFTFNHGEPLWVSKAALEEEASGYFLIPAGLLPEGWTSVPADEGKKVWGRGLTYKRDKSATTSCDQKSCNNCKANGMAQYSVHLMLVSVNVVDIPVGYTPPRGPAVNFRVTYNQREANPTLASIFLYGNLGPNWTHDYFTYVHDLGTAGSRDPVTRYSAGGGSITHAGYNAGTGRYTIDRFGGVLQYIPPTGTEPDRYELLYADGSKLVFAQKDGTDTYRNFLLSKEVDAAGNEVTLSYDETGRITHINDALGQSTVLHYDLPGDDRKITSVSDPFGRTAYFEYDQNGMLKQITDVGGLSSAFGYGTYLGASVMHTMTTPYGSTTFEAYEGNGNDPYPRKLLVTDPNGDREYFVSKHDPDNAYGLAPETAPAPVATAAGPVTFNTNWFGYRNTYHFDKKAMSGVTGLPTNYNTATIYHWLHGSQDGLVADSPTLESLKRPGQSRVYFWYQGQGLAGPYYDTYITYAQPSFVAQVVEDSSSGTGFSNKVQRYAYNAVGNVTNYTDPLGRVTAVDYYPNGIDVQKVRRLVNGGAASEVLAELGAYNAAHRPAYYTNAARQRYSFQWQPDGRLAGVTNPLSEVTRLNYYTAATTNDPNYQQLQNLQQDWSGGTKTTTLAYDNYRQVHTVTGSDSYALTYHYDVFDRVTQVTYPDNTFEKYQYDRLDLAFAWDRAGKRTKITYDNTRRPLTVKDHLNRVTSFGWCGCGGLDSLTDPMGRVTTWVRDIAGRVTDKIYDDLKTTHYAYEPLSGRLASITDAKTQVKHYAYNLDGTLKNATHTGVLIATPDVSFTYDPERRRMVTMTDGTGTTTNGYHPITTSVTLGAGRLASVDGPLAADTITYGYDPLGRVLSQAVNGVGESLAFDSLGRLTSHVTPLGTFISGYIGDTHRLASFAYPNNQTTTFDYFGVTGDLRLKQIWNLKSGGTTLSKFDYDYDVLGRIRHWTQQADAATPQVLTLDYDAEDQLLNAVVTPQNGSPAKAFAYAYDAMGNRQSEQRDVFTPSQSSTVTTGAFNDVNQLTAQNAPGPVPVQFRGRVNEAATVSVGGQAAQVLPDPDSATGGRTFSATLSLAAGNHTVGVVAKDFGASGGNAATNNYSLTVAAGAARAFTYDNNGNCTTNGSVSYEWDAEDRLVAINNAPLRSEFTYDGFGRRVRIVEKNGGSVTSTKQFIWCGKHIGEERDGANVVTKRFYAEGQINYQPSTLNLFYTCDHLGSIREVTDSNGTVRARYDYDPYGRVTKVSGDVDSDFLYTGHYYHAPSGLHLAMYRAYDAETGRWLNRDPIEENGGINLYAYVRDNPANLIDPDGRLFWIPILAIAAIYFATEMYANAPTNEEDASNPAYSGLTGDNALSYIDGAAAIGGLVKNGLAKGARGLAALPCKVHGLSAAKKLAENGERLAVTYNPTTKELWLSPHHEPVPVGTAALGLYKHGEFEWIVRLSDDAVQAAEKAVISVLE